MIRKNVYAEDNYRKASLISLDTQINADKAFSLVEDSINLAPRSRYYLFLADVIGKRISLTKESEELPLKMASFLDNLEHNSSFNALSKDEKYEFNLKIGKYLGNSNDSNKKPSGTRTCLEYSLESYDKAIKLFPNRAEAYQGKYLTQRNNNLYLDAITTIEEFFNNNPDVNSELTIKGLLVDWADLVRIHTGFTGGVKDIQEQRNNPQNKKLWNSLRATLEKFRNYYQNNNIRGNKNLQDALLISQRISLDEE